MIINGLQRLSLLDYPGYTAATIFFGGCNFRCPYCHNSDLVLTPDKTEEMTEEDVLKFLGTRKGLLDGVCITGGEPLLKQELLPFLTAIKEEGFKIKLDTNGSLPKRLKELLDSGVIDYVAMDVKNAKSKYAITAGLPKLINDNMVLKVGESIELLKNGNVDYEFRTTVTKELHSINDMIEIGEWIRGSKRYFIQNFIDSGKTIKSGFSGQSNKWLLEVKDKLTPYIGEVRLRG